MIHKESLDVFDSEATDIETKIFRAKFVFEDITNIDAALRLMIHAQELQIMQETKKVVNFVRETI